MFINTRMDAFTERKGLRKQFLRLMSSNPGQFNTRIHHTEDKCIWILNCMVYGSTVVCCKDQNRAVCAETPAQEPRVDAEPVDIRETGLRNQTCGGGHPISPKYQKLRFLLKHKFGTEGRAQEGTRCDTR